MHTIDLTAEQLTYLRTLVLSDLLENQRVVRGPAFDRYGETEAKRIHDDIATGSALVALLPNPRRADVVTLPLRFVQGGGL